MFDLSFRPMATNDIEEIYDYYKAINPKLAEAFMKDLRPLHGNQQEKPHNMAVIYLCINI